MPFTGPTYAPPTGTTTEGDGNVLFAAFWNALLVDLAGAINSLASSQTGGLKVVATAINFNASLTDTPVVLPAGLTQRYTVSSVQLNNASASLTTATVGVFGATSGGAPTIAADQAITVATLAVNTINNTQSLTLTNALTEAYNLSTLYIRVGTKQGGTATADVVLNLKPLT